MAEFTLSFFILIIADIVGFAILRYFLKSGKFVGQGYGLHVISKERNPKLFYFLIFFYSVLIISMNLFFVYNVYNFYY